MKYLVEVTETYRVDTEREAAILIEDAKSSQKKYSLVKYSSVQKERKQKGEVIDSWFKVSLTKHVTDEKEPCFSVTPVYEASGAFPSTKEEKKDEDIEDED